MGKEYDNELADLLKDKEYALKIFGIERGNKSQEKILQNGLMLKKIFHICMILNFYKNTQEYPYQPAISNKEDISKILDFIY